MMCTRKDLTKKKQYKVWLDPQDWESLDFIVFKYKAKSRSTAVRVAINMLAHHLGHDVGEFGTFGPLKRLKV